MELWLTERYALFQETKNSINQFEIHHLEWSTNQVEIQDLKLNYSRFKTLIQTNPTLAQYSPGVQVIAWRIIRNGV